MKKKLFALKIEYEKGKFNLQTQATDFNNFEVIAILREYCDELEKRLIGGKFKNMNMSVDEPKEES